MKNKLHCPQSFEKYGTSMLAEIGDWLIICSIGFIQHTRAYHLLGHSSAQ
jgi:hypothetical protein